jgi:hypothetical protein
MSRHEIPAFDPVLKVIVGWDPSLETFFAQVIDREKEKAGKEKKFVLWVGCSLREIYEIDALAKRLARYAVLTRDMMAVLYGDKDEGR